MPQTFPSEVLFLRKPETKAGVSQDGSHGIGTLRQPCSAVRDVVSRLCSTSDDPVQYVDLPQSGSSFSPHFLVEASAEAGIVTRLEGGSLRVEDGSSGVKSVRSPVEGVDSHSKSEAEIHWPSSVSRLCEEYRAQWRRLKSLIGSNKVVGVLGLNAGCGTTTVAATIAKMWADSPSLGNHSQVEAFYLIDGNLRNPSVSQTLQTTDRWPWTDWKPGMVPSLPTDRRLSVWSLTCAIFDPNFDTKAERGKDAPNSISYYLPQAASGPVVSRLFQLLDHVGRGSSGTIVDLGDCHFWTRLGFLEKLATAVDTMVLVVPCPLDQREVSLAFWNLQQAGMKSCVVLENSPTV